MIHRESSAQGVHVRGEMLSPYAAEPISVRYEEDQFAVREKTRLIVPTAPVSDGDPVFLGNRVCAERRDVYSGIGILIRVERHPMAVGRKVCLKQVAVRI